MTGRWWFYLREYYAINRRVWPEMSRRAAFVDALRLALRICRGAS